MAYKLAVLEILRNLFVLAYIACLHYPYIIIESTDDSMMITLSSIHSFQHCSTIFCVLRKSSGRLGADSVGTLFCMLNSDASSFRT